MLSIRGHVSKLTKIIHEDRTYFVPVNPRRAYNKKYGKEIEPTPNEVRVLLDSNGGIYDSLRRGIARAELYLISRFSKDSETREMARKGLMQAK